MTRQSCSRCHAADCGRSDEGDQARRAALHSSIRLVLTVGRFIILAYDYASAYIVLGLFLTDR